ncbi:MAG: type II toxin-antitoxin system RelE/ParE family toxin [Cloacibacillus sp.]
MWDIEVTDEFELWWDAQNDAVHEDVAAVVDLLEEHGPSLGRPYSGEIRGSRHKQMRELIVQSGGNPYRILYAFDPRRTAVLLLAGCKGGANRWYEEHVPKADKLFDKLLEELKNEGVI